METSPKRKLGTLLTISVIEEPFKPSLEDSFNNHYAVVVSSVPSIEL